MSLIDDIRKLSDEQLDEALALAESLYDDRNYDWPLNARPEQLAPEGDWIIWLLVTGRRWGKTRSAAEWMRDRSLEEVGSYAICAPTYGDVRDVCVEGGQAEPANRRSGFISVCRPGEIETYNRSLGEIRMKNGSKIKMLSADEPDRARGWGFMAAWCDEFSSWRRPATWYETLLPAVTMADKHRFMITTTPKPNPLTKALIQRAATDPSIVFTRGRTMDNAKNLGAGAVDELRSQMTERQARQELEGELLLDNPGAVFQYDNIDRNRVFTGPKFSTVAVGVDPSGGSGPNSDEQGIIVGGKGFDGHGYTLADVSCSLSPNGWGRRAVQAYLDHEADVILVERNYGGDMARDTILRAAQDMGVVMVDGKNLKMITSSRGKRLRAEPVAALYEQGRWHHVGAFPELEDQMIAWTPESGDSPDRMDALCFVGNYLFGEPEKKGFVLV